MLQKLNFILMLTFYQDNNPGKGPNLVRILALFFSITLNSILMLASIYKNELLLQTHYFTFLACQSTLVNQLEAFIFDMPIFNGCYSIYLTLAILPHRQLLLIADFGLLRPVGLLLHVLAIGLIFQILPLVQLIWFPA